MAAQSKTPSTRRKSKSVSHPKVISLTQDSRRTQGFSALAKFLKTITPSERRLINPLLSDLTYPWNALQEMRNLLGKPMEQCQVIPFPANRTTINGG